MKNHNPFCYFKTSPEIIRLAVMMYVRFPLSLRNVEDLLHKQYGAKITPGQEASIHVGTHRCYIQTCWARFFRARTALKAVKAEDFGLPGKGVPTIVTSSSPNEPRALR